MGAARRVGRRSATGADATGADAGADTLARGACATELDGPDAARPQPDCRHRHNGRVAGPNHLGEPATTLLSPRRTFFVSARRLRCATMSACGYFFAAASSVALSSNQETKA